MTSLKQKQWDVTNGTSTVHLISSSWDNIGQTCLIRTLDSVILNAQTCIPNQLNNEYPQLYIFEVWVSWKTCISKIIPRVWWSPFVYRENLKPPTSHYPPPEPRLAKISPKCPTLTITYTFFFTFLYPAKLQPLWKPPWVVRFFGPF